MADNYLENKMAEHRAGASAAKVKRRLTPCGYASGTASFLQFPVGMGVLVISSDTSRTAAETIIPALVNAGCRVAFISTDKTWGTSLARLSGAQYHPGNPGNADDTTRSLAMLRRHWLKEPEAVINLGVIPPAIDGWLFVGEESLFTDSRCAIGLPDEPSETFAQDVLYTLLPQSRKFLPIHKFFAHSHTK